MVVIILLLGGFIVYDKVLKKNECPICETETKSSSNSFEAFKTAFIANRKKSMTSNTNNIAYFEYTNGYVAVSENGTLFYTNDDGNKVTIASNVLMYDFLHIGNGDWNMLYIIKEDGTVTSTNVYIVDDDSKLHINGNAIKVEDNYQGYKNIVGFLDGSFSTCKEICDSAGSPSFVDIDGNIYNINIK